MSRAVSLLLALIVTSSFCTPLKSQIGGFITVPGEVTVGDSFADGLTVQNGFATTLGRLFVRIRGLDEDVPEDPGLPMEILLTSNVAIAEPVTCSSPSSDVCFLSEPGFGDAQVAGFPTSIDRVSMTLKLAAAFYLPLHLPPGMAGTSVEMAWESFVAIGTGSDAGDSFEIILRSPSQSSIGTWQEFEPGDPTSRVFPSNTGTGLLLRNYFSSELSGTIKGEVVSNNGNSLVLACQTTTWSANREDVHLVPDFEAAAAAGFSNSFCVLEINYGGDSLPSKIYPGATSDNVEVFTSGAEYGPLFVRGDCNGDGNPAGLLTDAIFLLNYSFAAGEEPPCMAACDANGDGSTGANVTDPIVLLNFAFNSGAPPPAPYPFCGIEPPGGPVSSKLLGCETGPAVCPEL